MSFIASQSAAVSFAAAGSQVITIPNTVDASNSGLSSSPFRHMRMDALLSSNGIASISFSNTPASQTVSVASAGGAVGTIIIDIPAFAASFTLTAAQAGTVLLHYGLDR